MPGLIDRHVEFVGALRELRRVQGDSSLDVTMKD